MTETDTTIVLSQLADVRDTGLTNMLDRNNVQVIAHSKGMYELVNYIDDHGTDAYMELLEEMGEQY